LPIPAGPEISCRSSPVESPAEKRVQLRDAARYLTGLEGGFVLRCDEAREDDEAASHDAELMKPLAECNATELEDLEPPMPNPVVARNAFEPERPVRDALELEVAVLGGQVIEHHRRALKVVADPFEVQDLPSMA
jgi:hypothetical protein